MTKQIGVFLLLVTMMMASDSIINTYPNTIAGCAQQAPFVFAELGTWGPLFPWSCPAYHDVYYSGVSVTGNSWNCVYGGWFNELPGKQLLEQQWQIPHGAGGYCTRIRDYYPLPKIQYDVTACQPVTPSAHWMYFEYFD